MHGSDFFRNSNPGLFAENGDPMEVLPIGD